MNAFKRGHVIYDLYVKYERGLFNTQFKAG